MEERLYDVYALDEDIKILVKLQNRTKPIAEDLETSVCSIDEQLAIRNLIEAYRKVKEEIQRKESIIKHLENVKAKYYEDNVLLLRKNGHLDILLDNLNCVYIDDGKKYIPKSKIKEKIEEYKQEADEETNIEAFSKIDALEELLEEE